MNFHTSFFRDLKRLVSSAAVAVLAAAVQAQTPAQVGSWTAPQLLPTHAIHAMMLATGKVLYWDRVGNDYLYDPVTQNSTPAALPPMDVFCSGIGQLGDGTIFVAGGHIVDDNGLNTAAIYNPFTNSWKSLPNMAYARWYPTVTVMPNGKDVFVNSGEITPTAGNCTISEYWSDAAKAFIQLPGTDVYPQLYPFNFLSPTGNIISPGTQPQTWLYTTAGAGSVTTITHSPTAEVRSYGSAALFAPGKYLVGGGGDPIASCLILDLTGTTPVWTATGSMASARRQFDFTLMPTGHVLAEGGSSGPGFTNSAYPVYTPEDWDPATGVWTPLAPCTTTNQSICFRGYHSNAVLLPDATLWSTAGDDFLTDPSWGYPNYQIFSPPYLFAATKPVLTSGPAYAAYGSTINIGCQSTAPITQVNLIRLAAVTHDFNMSQTIAKLTFTQNANGSISAQIPTDPIYSPPGYYHIFAIDSNGGVSHSLFLQVGSGESGLNSIAVSSIGTVTWTNPNPDSSEIGVATSPDGVNFGATQDLPDNGNYTPTDPSANYVKLQAVGTATSAMSVPLRVTPTTTSLTVQNASGLTDGLTSARTTLLDGNGIPVPYVPVQVSVAGTVVGSAITDKTGYAEVGFFIKAGWSGATITASFAAQGVWGSSTGTSTLSVTPRQTSMNVAVRTGAVGQNVYLMANMLGLPTNYNVVTAGELITFAVDGKVLGSGLTNSTGYAHLNWTVTPGHSVRTITCTFAGDASYVGCSGTNSLTVTGGTLDTTATSVANTSVVGGNTAQVLATLTDVTSGQVMPNATLNVSINGVASGTVTTNTSGAASISVPTTVSTPSPVTVVASFPGDVNDKPSQGTGSVIVTAGVQDPTATAVGTATVSRGSTVQVPVTLQDTTTGLPMPNATLSVTINGTASGAVTTNTIGAANIPVTASATSPATLTVIASFAGDPLHQPSQGTGAVTVNLDATTTTLVNASVVRGSTAQVTATLLDTTTSAPVSGATLTVTLNGVASAGVTTNASGTATIPVATNASSPATITVVASFAGDTTHQASQGAGTVTVTAAKVAVYLWVGTRTVAPGATVQDNLVLRNNVTGVGLVSETVSLSANGVSLGTVTTDSTGHANFNVTAPSGSSGTITVTATFAGDANYLPQTATGIITIS